MRKGCIKYHQLRNVIIYILIFIPSQNIMYPEIRKKALLK